MKLADLMTRDVVTLNPGDTVQHVARTFVQNRISAAPVVDGDGKILGIVSEGDLVRRSESRTLYSDSWWLDIFSSASERVDEFKKLHGATAEDVMTEDVVTVAPDTDVKDVARILASKSIKRVPVVGADGRIAGIVSRADLIHGLAFGLPPADRVAADVQNYADTVQAVRDVLSVAKTRSHLVNAIVDESRVELYGIVDSEAERTKIVNGLRALPGIDTVDTHLLRTVDVVHLPIRG